MRMVTGKRYDVVYAEMEDGTLITEEMELVRTIEHKGKEVYIFKDDQGYYMASYKYEDDEIDWDFMEEINNEFIE